MSESPKPKKKINYNLSRVTLIPSVNNKFRACYDEYVMDCQQHHHRPPRFNDFMIEMAEVGFEAWKAKVKKHA